MIQIAFIIIFLLPYFLWNLEYIIYKIIVKNYLKELYIYLTTDKNLIYTKYELSNKSLIYLHNHPNRIRSKNIYSDYNLLFLDKIFDYYTYINITNNKLDISFYIIKSSLLFKIYESLLSKIENKITLENNYFYIQQKDFTIVLKDYYDLYNILKKLPNKHIKIIKL
jgi:hypothetical protein